jgi:hypothetical protein
MIGPKLDLPSGGSELDNATVLVPCVYRGVSDTSDDRWTYYKVKVEQSQTLSVFVRLRDSKLLGESKLVSYLVGVAVRLHGPNGGNLGETGVNTPSGVQRLEYKAAVSDFAYVGLHHAVRDAVFQFSIAPTKP